MELTCSVLNSVQNLNRSTVELREMYVYYIYIFLPVHLNLKDGSSW